MKEITRICTVFDFNKNKKKSQRRCRPVCSPLGRPMLLKFKTRKGLKSVADNLLFPRISQSAFAVVLSNTSVIR